MNTFEGVKARILKIERNNVDSLILQILDVIAVYSLALQSSGYDGSHHKGDHVVL